MAVLTACAALGYAVATPNQAAAGPPVARASGADAWMDREYGGAGTVSGTTEVKTGAGSSTPLGLCPVFLFHLESKTIVRAGRSDAAGNYSFASMDPSKHYFAVAFDPAGTYDMAATQNLQVTP